MKEKNILKKVSEIKTKRLVMHSYNDTDLEAMINLLCNDEIKKTYMIPDFTSHEDAILMFERIKSMSYSDEHFEYGVFLNEELIGFINDVEIHGDIIEIGYVIRPDMSKKGYATEVLSAAINELFRVGYRVVRAGLFEENIASKRVMEKCGMNKIEHTEKVTYRGEVHNCIYYEIRNN